MTENIEVPTSGMQSKLQDASIATATKIHKRARSNPTKLSQLKKEFKMINGMGEYKLNLLQNYIEVKLGLIKKVSSMHKAIQEVEKMNNTVTNKLRVEPGVLEIEDSPRDSMRWR
jgi:hypothetical protein